MARLYGKQQRWGDAAGRLAELILGDRPDAARTIAAVAAALAPALEGKTDPGTAEPVLRECRAVLVKKMVGGDWLTAEVTSRYGDCLRRQGNPKDAERILVAAAADMGKAVGAPAWSVALARKRVADLYEAQGKAAEAAKWR